MGAKPEFAKVLMVAFVPVAPTASFLRKLSSLLKLFATPLSGSGAVHDRCWIWFFWPDRVIDRPVAYGRDTLHVAVQMWQRPGKGGFRR